MIRTMRHSVAQRLIDRTRALKQKQVSWKKTLKLAIREKVPGRNLNRWYERLEPYLLQQKSDEFLGQESFITDGTAFRAKEKIKEVIKTTDKAREEMAERMRISCKMFGDGIPPGAID